MAKKWLHSIEKQKRRSNLCDRQTDGQTDRVNDKQESCAIAKMTAQCALHMGALEIFLTA